MSRPHRYSSPRATAAGSSRIMQPQRAHDRQARSRRSRGPPIQVRHQAIAQLQVLAADRLDARVVQLRRIGMIASRRFRDSRARRCSSPRAGAASSPAVRAEQRAERAELEPAHVQLARKFLRGNEAADVGAPVGNAGQAGVDPDGTCVFSVSQRGMDIARPEERRVPLHARVAVAVQRIDAARSAGRAAGLPSTSGCAPAARPRRAVALVRPPAVHAQIETAACAPASSNSLPVWRPMIVGRAPRRQRRGRARIGYRSDKVVAFDHDMQHHLKLSA